jgi:hypothetical protein
LMEALEIIHAMTKPYFHLVTEHEWNVMKAVHMTWGELSAKYAPPDWCSYPDAVDPMGCWSLVGRMVTGEDYCKSCDLYCATPAVSADKGKS